MSLRGKWVYNTDKSKFLATFNFHWLSDLQNFPSIGSVTLFDTTCDKWPDDLGNFRQVLDGKWDWEEVDILVLVILKKIKLPSVNIIVAIWEHTQNY